MKLNESITLQDYLAYKNNSKKICINRASLENGIPTSEPMACKSGDTINLELFENYTVVDYKLINSILGLNKCKYSIYQKDTIIKQIFLKNVLYHL